MSDPAGSQPLRVLHVVEAFGGGVFEMVKALSERSAAAGDTVAIAYGRRPETPADVRDRIAAEVELRPLSWGARTTPLQPLRAARELRHLRERWRPDVVHLHSSFAGVVGSLALGRSTPTVYTPHGYSFTMRDLGRARRLAFRALERLTAHRVSLVGAVSEAEAAAARQVAPADRVVVVRNGIPELDDPPADRPLPPLPDRPLAITMGRITAQHLPAETARILAAVEDVAKIEWVGGAGRGDVPATVVTDLGVPVSGWMARPKALERLRAATVCLHWTAWDGQPLTLLEAMADDVVVIARDIEATREILGAAQVRSDEREAVALLREVLGSEALRRQLIESQRARRAEYGAQRMADEWQAIYRQLAGPVQRHPHP